MTSRWKASLRELGLRSGTPEPIRRENPASCAKEDETETLCAKIVSEERVMLNTRPHLVGQAPVWPIPLSPASCQGQKKKARRGSKARQTCQNKRWLQGYHNGTRFGIRGSTRKISGEPWPCRLRCSAALPMCLGLGGSLEGTGCGGRSRRGLDWCWCQGFAKAGSWCLARRRESVLTDRVVLF